MSLKGTAPFPAEDPHANSRISPTTALKVRPAGSQGRVVAVQVTVQAIRYYLSRIHMADSTDPVLVLEGVSRDALMGRGHVVGIGYSTVAADAVLRIVH